MKKYISAILVPCLLLQLNGCYSFQNISKYELSNQGKSDDITFIDNNGYKYLFRAQDYTISNDSIEGKGLKSKINNDLERELFKGKYAVTDMKSLEADRFNFVRTSLLVLSIVGIIYILGYYSITGQKVFRNFDSL